MPRGCCQWPSSSLPLEAAGLCVRALDLAGQAAQRAKPSILSDVEAGALLLRSAGEAVLLNVDINLPALGDGPQGSGFEAERPERGFRAARGHAKRQGSTTSR